MSKKKRFCATSLRNTPEHKIFRKTLNLFRQARFQMEVHTISLQFEEVFYYIINLWKFEFIENITEARWQQLKSQMKGCDALNLFQQKKMSRIKNLHVEIYMNKF